MHDYSSDIDKLKIKIVELELEILACNVRLRAFRELVGMTFETQGKTLEKFDSALKELEQKIAHDTLRTYADKNPTYAAIAQEYLKGRFSLP